MQRSEEKGEKKCYLVRTLLSLLLSAEENESRKNQYELMLELAFIVNPFYKAKYAMCFKYVARVPDVCYTNAARCTRSTKTNLSPGSLKAVH